MIRLIQENQTRVSLPARIKFNFWLKSALQVLKKNQTEGIIELFFVTPAKIKTLNKEYRGKDKVTDVLSFSFIDQPAFPNDNLLGQIFIEPITAKKQAKEHRVEWKDEIEFLFVHALLHLFGHDHENFEDFKLMFGLQAQIMPGRKWATFVEQIRLENFDVPEA